jgi:hypothetical protein
VDSTTGQLRLRRTLADFQALRPAQETEVVPDLDPGVVRLAPDYGASLPLWGEGSGNIDWRFTKFPPQLLDRLAAWQRDFDDNYHYQTGWRSAATRDRWAHHAQRLAADVRATLGTRAELVVDLWPIYEKT